AQGIKHAGRVAAHRTHAVAARCAPDVRFELIAQLPEDQLVAARLFGALGRSRRQRCLGHAECRLITCYWRAGRGPRGRCCHWWSRHGVRCGCREWGWRLLEGGRAWWRWRIYWRARRLGERSLCGRRLGLHVAQKVTVEAIEFWRQLARW